MTRRSFFEDFVAGETIEFGNATVDAAELHAFAERYDPQPIHIDVDAAAASPFGGIIASGWQTAGLTMRMVLDHVVDARNSLGSPGIGRLSWLLPVRASDVLHVRLHVRAARRSQSKPDRGLVTLEVETLNARGEVVMRAEDWIAIVRLRHPDAP
ncbi:MAG: MaoC family dehydratase [Candidatus Velthaea sp.]